MTELAGRLGDAVTIMRLAPDRDAAGASLGLWDIVAAQRAEVIPDGVAKAEAAGAVAGLARWHVTVRHPTEVLVGDRLGWNGRRLAVRFVRRDPRTPDRIEIFCEEVR